MVLGEYNPTIKKLFLDLGRLYAMAQFSYDDGILYNFMFMSSVIFYVYVTNVNAILALRISRCKDAKNY